MFHANTTFFFFFFFFFFAHCSASCQGPVETVIVLNENLSFRRPEKDPEKLELLAEMKRQTRGEVGRLYGWCGRGVEDVEHVYGRFLGKCV